MVKRLLNPSKNHSFFLFGARGTGKSTFIKRQFLHGSDLPWIEIDLLDPDKEEEYSRSPMHLYELVKSQFKKKNWIFIDEVQKVPKLLDVVHKCIAEFEAKFILTGSSARKLKRGGANLLAGRAFLNSIYPFTESELGEQFQLDEILRWGSLPKIFSFDDQSDKKNYLKSYSQTYLREEIKLEQLVRNIDPFREFLEVAAQMSGKVINYSSIGKDVGVEHKTIQNYFEILADTWIGFILPAFHQSVRKSQLLSPKFYYFDLGVKNSLAHLLDSKPVPGNSFYGDLFEHYMINEVFRYNQYHAKDYRLSYLLTKNNAEIDLILSKGRAHYAIEIKSSDKIDRTEVAKLNRLSTDISNLKQAYYISCCKEDRVIEGVRCMHWKSFLKHFCKDL